MFEKPVFWIGSSLDDVRAFPANARRQVGYQLGRVQQGLTPSDWKPMTAVGPGVHEIRVHTGLEHRVFYLSRFVEAVYVLHAFEKRTRRTPRSQIECARKRLTEVIQFRRRQESQ